MRVPGRDEEEFRFFRTADEFVTWLNHESADEIVVPSSWVDMIDPIDVMDAGVEEGFKVRDMGDSFMFERFFPKEGPLIKEEIK